MQGRKNCWVPLKLQPKYIHATVDEEDLEEVLQYTWLCLKRKSLWGGHWRTAYTVVLNDAGRPVKFWLHRFVTRAGPSDRISFKSPYHLDCRKSNLLIGGRPVKDRKPYKDLLKYLESDECKSRIPMLDPTLSSDQSWLENLEQSLTTL